MSNFFTDTKKYYNKYNYVIKKNIKKINYHHFKCVGSLNDFIILYHCPRVQILIIKNQCKYSYLNQWLQYDYIIWNININNIKKHRSIQT